MATAAEPDCYDMDYEFPPKPTRTYGKRGTKVQATTVRSVKKEAPPVATSPSPPASPEPKPRSRVVASSSKSKQQPQRYGRAAIPRRADETRSQPLPGPTEMDLDDDSKPRKRKLVRSQSEKKEKVPVPYSTPDSSPSSPQVRKQEPIPRSVPAPKAQPKPRGTPERDAKTKSVVSQDMPFSAKTSRALDSLSLSSDAPTRAKQTIPLRLSRPQPAPSVSKSIVRKRVSPEMESSKAKAKAVAGLATKKRASPETDGSKAKISMGQITKRRASPESVSTAKAATGQAPKKRASPESGFTAKSGAGQAPKKRRLIDALTAQADSSSEDEGGEYASQETTISRNRPASPVFQSSSPPPSSAPPKAKTAVRPVHSSKQAGPKFTYSQKRTMLAEEDDIFSGGPLGAIDEEPSSNGPLFNFGRTKKSSTFSALTFMDEDDETANTGAVRSIHELRQAGANSRFADEMEDILDRIGEPTAKPSSLRRGALLELAEKIKDKDFRQQFRNHGDSSRAFRLLAEETDVVSGYCIVATLATLLGTSVSGHLLQQVLESGLASLLGRLLKEPTDIVLLVKDRKQNVSRHGQTTLGAIKSSFLQLPIWEPISPTTLSPRTLSLKCLDLIMRQSSHASSEAEVFTSEVTDRLFAILSTGTSNEDAWDFPAHQASADFYLALYVAEGHSISAMQSRLGTRWTRQYVPIVADLLGTALRRPADKINDIESLALRVTINMTNNNADACRMLVDKNLFLSLAESTCTAFDLSLNSMKADSFLPKVHESLIMMLGVMINFCVYYPPASQSLEERAGVTGSPLDRLIRVFADNHAKTADVSSRLLYSRFTVNNADVLLQADSIQKTQLNVALGYLSILLGYLCLSQPILERFASVHPRKSLQPLIDSINEFIDFHHKVANAQQEGDFAALGRLKNLVSQLEAKFLG